MVPITPIYGWARGPVFIAEAQDFCAPNHPSPFVTKPYEVADFLERQKSPQGQRPRPQGKGAIFFDRGVVLQYGGI